MRQVKLKREDFDNIYFASDFHWNHSAEFLWKPRGFGSKEGHDAWIESEVSKLTERDLLIFLGDTALNSSYEGTEAFIFGIKAKKFWIWGNHASWDYPLYLKYAGLTKESSYEIYPLSCTKDVELNSVLIGYDKQGKGAVGYNKQAELVFFGEELNLKIGKDSFYCRHMAPFIWDKMKHGVMALCGHSHGNCQDINQGGDVLGKILDVGVDNAMRYNGTAFFRYEEVLDIMNNKPIVIHDHHGDEHV